VEYHLGEIETRFAELIWDNEPVSSTELVRLAENALSWKKSTTYTVLRRLTDKGIFKNENGMVKSVLSRDEFAAARSEKFVDETFSGSLPLFLAAFATRKKLTAQEVEQIQRFIDENRG